MKLSACHMLGLPDGMFAVRLSATEGDKVTSVPVIWTAKDLEGPTAGRVVQDLFVNAIHALQFSLEEK